MEFGTKAEIVAECWMTVREEESWEELIKYGDLGFPFAYGFVNDLITLSEQGETHVVDIYNIIVKSLDIPDEDYKDFEALLDKHIELHPQE